MMNQAYVMEKLAKEHQNNLLKEADAYRAAHQVKKEPRLQANMLKRMAVRLVGLLIDLVRQLSDQDSFFTDEAFTDSYR